MAGDGALSRSGRAVDGDDDLAGRRERAERGGTHPRFFVPCLGRAVKPNRLLFPALAPAASAGLRLLPREALAPRTGLLAPREVVADFPAGLEPLELTLRCPQAGAGELAERVPEAPLAGRAAGRPFPLEGLPLFEAVPAWASLRLPWAPAPALVLQRAVEADRAPLAGRTPAGRESEATRRAGRLPEDDCAGLRSREGVAGRLKWGREAADFPLAAGLRVAAARGV